MGDLGEGVVVEVLAIVAGRNGAGHEELHLVLDLARVDGRCEELFEVEDELPHVHHARDALRLLVADDVQVAVDLVQRFVADDLAQRRRRAAENIDERLLGEVHLERPAGHEAEAQRVERQADDQRAQMALQQHVVEVDVELQPQAAEERADDVGGPAVVEAARRLPRALQQRHVRLHRFEQHLVVLLLRRELDHDVLLVGELVGHLDLVVHDRPVQVRQHRLRLSPPRGAHAVEVVPVVHAAIVLNEVVQRHFGAHMRIVRVAVQHDRRVCQHINAVLVAEHVGVVLVVALRERLHQPVDLLRLARQPAPRKSPPRLPEPQLRDEAAQRHVEVQSLPVRPAYASDSFSPQCSRVKR